MHVQRHHLNSQHLELLRASEGFAGCAEQRQAIAIQAALTIGERVVLWIRKGLVGTRQSPRGMLAIRQAFVGLPGSASGSAFKTAS